MKLPASLLQSGALALALLALTSMLAATGCAQSPPEPLVVDQTEEVSARVQAVYSPTRMVTLVNDAGDTVSLTAGPEVVNFDQIQVGDRVVVRYYDAMAFELKAPGEATVGVQTDVAATRAEPGQRPAGAVGETTRTSVKIEGVDKSRNTVTFRGQDGLVRMIDVLSPEGREFIKRLKPGDEVEVTYTEALAVSVEPAN